MAPSTQGSPHRVVVVGGGFGGLQAALKLARLPVEVTLVDRRNFHLFQPLAYQVATGAISPAEICYPLRRIFRRRRNVRVVLAEVVDVDLGARRVALSDVALGTAPEALEYDTLIVSGGSEYSYFGHDEWQEHAAELKSLEGALTIRRHILEAFEAAELEPDPDRQAALLTFVVVGAGPPGSRWRARSPRSGTTCAVTSATSTRDGAHPARRGARSDTHDLPAQPLGQGAALAGEPRGHRAAGRVGGRGRRGQRDGAARGRDDRADPDANRHLGRRGAPPRRWRGAGRAGRREVDRAGRLVVEPDLSCPGIPRCSRSATWSRSAGRRDGARPPGVAPVAMQQGRHGARVVADRLAGREPKPFHYSDKGNLATIGRARAVADVKGVHLSGLLAWDAWLVVHLWYLIGFQNRLLVVIRWAVSFFTHGRGARLIAHD